VDPELAVVRRVELRAALAESLGETRTVSRLMGALAALALVLALVGLYAVLAFAVERRRRELGIRTALGASPRAIVRLVLGDGLALALTGILVGIAVAYAVSTSLRSLLYGVSPGDPVTTAATALLLLAVATLAALIPARRATRTDTVACLRQE
jgi:ABC-type antimicrobial peptide transport system permease subunit